MGPERLFSGEYLSAENGRGAASIQKAVSFNVALLDEISGLPILGQNLNSVDMAGKVAGGSFVDHVAGLVYTPGPVEYHQGLFPGNRRFTIPFCADASHIRVYRLHQSIYQDTGSRSFALIPVNPWLWSRGHY